MLRSKGWPTSKPLPSGNQPHNLREMVSWTAPPCLGVLGCRDYLCPKDFQGTQDHEVVQHKEMVALAMALQSCTIHPGTPLGMLCRVVQELHRCLTSMIESGDLIDLKMLDVAKRDPMAPTSEGRPPSPTPGAEPLVSVPTSSGPTASESKEAAPPQETLPLCQDEDH